MANLYNSAKKAREENMTVVHQYGNFYMVYTEKGTEYGIVTAPVGKANIEMIVDCTCPAREHHRDTPCKHMIKASMQINKPVYVGH